MSYRRASSDEFDGLAALLFDSNGDAARRDLHTYGHPGPEGLAADMRGYAAKGEFLALVADDGASAVAAEISPETRRAWAWGPAFADARRHKSVNCAAAYVALIAELPPEIARVSAFPDVANEAAIAGFERIGGARTDVTHVYGATRSSWVERRDDRVRPAQVGDEAFVAGLHEAAFPGTYSTPVRLFAEHASGEGRLLVWPEVGYACARVQSDGTGYVDYLAVAEAARGQGAGSALLGAALDWLFGEKGVPEAFLTVRADNASALRLYTAAGFKVSSAGVAMDWRRGGGGA